MKIWVLSVIAGAFVASAPALAQETYVSVSGGGSFLFDSDNEGEFTSDFVTGAGTTVPAGTVLPAGADVGWTTEFQSGYAIAGQAGRRYGPFRGELEVAFQNNDVDTHRGVAAAGVDLSDEDAGVLVTGASNLGVTAADLVADGQGSVDTLFLMANAYYDFDFIGPFKPYVGAGVGIGFVDVEYAPSATTIIDDRTASFAYQAMAGAAYELSRTIDLFAQYRYRATTDAQVEASLFDADFDIENRGSVIEGGVRVYF